ncbi:MAG: hypothetical protein QOI41_2808, partial [Myxococcales bacterium]|nr:hypothetical protein [Myxococcales bacterium]
MNDETAVKDETAAPAEPAAREAPAAPAEQAPKDELAFDRAEFAAAEDAAPACAFCKRVLGSSYFTINAAIACEDCHHLLATQVKESKGVRAFFRAAAFGTGAAIGGSIAWYAVAKITGLEIGLLAIAVGWAVGKAVRKGARGPGAKRYQALAMLLTYLSITGSYVPLVWKGVTEAQHETPAGKGAPAAAAGAAATAAPATPAGEPPAAAPPAASGAEPVEPAAAGFVRMVLTCIVVVALSLVAPFLGGASNILGIILIGIALYEAWKFNRGVPIVMDGPLRTNAVPRAPSAPS